MSICKEKHIWGELGQNQGRTPRAYSLSLTTLYYGTGEQFNMKGRSKKYYRKIFRAYPDMVTLLQFREMLSGVSDNFARKLIHEKHVKSIFIKPHYYISKNSVIDYVLSEDYAIR